MKYYIVKLMQSGFILTLIRAMKRRIFNCTSNNEDDQPLTIHSYIRMRKNKLYKNLILLSLSQSAMYVMYKTVMMIRGYEHDFIGIWSYTMFNAAKIFGFLLLPTFVLSLFKLQKTFRCGLIMNSALIFAHYMMWIETVVPVATFMGLVAAILWVSLQTYIYRLAKIMSKVAGDDLRSVLLRFSGIFYSIYRAYEMACYVPIAFIPSTRTISNYTKDYCGGHFHFGNYTSLSEFSLPQQNQGSFIASTTMIVLAFCALLLSILLIDSPDKLTETRLGAEKYNAGIATIIRLFKCRRLQLMIPMSIFAGYEKLTEAYDYSTGYVECSESASRAIDVRFLGSLAASQMSLSLAPLVEVTSLRVMLSLAASTHLILILILLLKNHIDLMGYYVISTAWGLASSTWDCLLYVLYGMLSTDSEVEAYCHLGLWYSVGAFSNLILIGFVGVSFKLWTAFVILLIATMSALMLPHIINYVPKKIEPINAEIPGRSGTSGSGGQGFNDKARKTGVYFGKLSASRDYYPPEVKSIYTSKIHHVAIPKTRPRFERHEFSNEDIRALF